jgi:hypothetical protein
MFCMSEHEKDLQIGKLVEEYGHARGKLNQVAEKLNRFQASCQIINNHQPFQSLRMENGKLIFSCTDVSPFDRRYQQKRSQNSFAQHI